MLASKVYICIIMVPGRLCSGDNRSVANATHSCIPGSSATWIQFTESTHSYWLNSLLLKVTLGMASVSSMTLIKVSWLCPLPSQQAMSKYISHGKPAHEALLMR